MCNLYSVTTSQAAIIAIARAMRDTTGNLPPLSNERYPWFIGVQFHPELKSRPFEPHPLFASFVEAALEQSRLV